MNTDFVQRLRSEMEQVAVRPRAGLAREAYRRYRNRRHAARAVAAAGTVAVAAAGTAIGVGATAGAGPNAAPAETTAHVVSRVSSALAATAGTITHTSEQITAPGMSGPPDVSTWLYGNQLRQQGETADGQAIMDTGDTALSNGTVTGIVVDYQSRTWKRTGYQGALPVVPDLCGPMHVLGGVPGYGSAADLRSMIQSGLRCGDLKVTGRQEIGGVDAITLTVHFKYSAPETIWVNPQTYLPVQMVTNPGIYVPAAASTGKVAVPVKEERTEFSWLPPTKANLAQLNVPIPPGFRKVSG